MINADIVSVILLHDKMIIGIIQKIDILSIIVLSVVMLSVIMPNAIMLYVIVMLSDIILSDRMLSVISFYVFVQKVDALSFIIFLS
jgi:hypothetical protein